MQPGEHISSGYKFDEIAGEAIRQEEALAVVSDIAEIMGSKPVTRLALNPDLEGLIHSTANLISARFWEERTTTDVSGVYETFEKDGITFESRIVRFATPESPNLNMQAVSIFMVSLMANNQIFSTSSNTRFGVITTGEGEQVFFKVVDDRSVRDERPFTGMMKYDWEKEHRVDALSPEDQFIVVKELQKAVKALSE